MPAVDATKASFCSHRLTRVCVVHGSVRGRKGRVRSSLRLTAPVLLCTISRIDPECQAAAVVLMKAGLGFIHPAYSWQSGKTRQAARQDVKDLSGLLFGWSSSISFPAPPAMHVCKVRKHGKNRLIGCPPVADHFFAPSPLLSEPP